jgi:hypothetical protein
MGTVVAAIALILATPVATWSLTGDLSEPISDPDYLIRPLVLPRAVEIVLLVISGAVVVGATAYLVYQRRTRRMDRKWVPPIVLLVVAGVVVGSGWRVLTAGVGGANIGGGMVILFGGPFVLALVIAAAWSATLPPRTVSGSDPNRNR